MSHSLEVVTDVEQFRQKLIPFNTFDGEGLKSVEEKAVLLGQLGGGILQLASVAFPELDNQHIYARKYTRESEGRGPHFDTYGTFLRSRHQHLALYNLAGDISLRAALLPDDLQDVYENHYPDLEDKKLGEAAYKARRHLSALVFDDPRTQIATADLSAGTSMVLSQRKAGPHVVHEIIPKDSRTPGEFIKLIAPSENKDSNAVRAMRKAGYTSLDEFITKNMTTPLPELVNSEPSIFDLLPSTPVSNTPKKPRSLPKIPKPRRKPRSVRQPSGYDDDGDSAVYD